ncbi:DUF58 domain-containing protein [Mongoliimonas terrestris]|uniref:DUF58 domain-containing protein n=1 Tax=Mongoliimonas terrestris TaxID=1709001 RepID=UPI0009F921E9|nr:DUF58 domain-containing protein [Mongoliimonas terrestris]
MVSAVAHAPGLRVTAADLMALRDVAPDRGRHRPATRRPGAVPGKPPGAGMDLREIRAFVEGDDARRIDPAATARTGQPHIRTFHEDRDDTVLLIADFRPSMLWGTGPDLRSVRAARALARRGWRAVARGAAVSAMVVDAHGASSLPFAAGANQMGRIAHMLATLHDRALDGPGAGRDVDPGPAVPALTGALVRAARLAPPGAEILFATGPDGVAADDEAALARLARRRRVAIVLPLDPIEIGPPAGAFPIRFGGAGRVARLAALDTAALSARFRTLNVVLQVTADDADAS